MRASRARPRARSNGSSTNANEMRFPSDSASASVRTFTGTIALSGVGSSPRVSARSRSAPAASARQTSLTVAPATVLTWRTASRSTEWRTSVRRGPMRALSTEAGAGRRRSSPAASAARLSVPAIRDAADARLPCHARGAERRAQGLPGSQRHGPCRQPCRSGRLRRLPRHRQLRHSVGLDVEQKLSHLDRRTAVHQGVVDLRHQPAAAVREARREADLPERPAPVKRRRQHAVAEHREPRVVEFAAERAERKHVPFDVEVGIVHPERLAHPRRRPGEPAPEARQALQPAGYVAAQAPQRRALPPRGHSEGGAPRDVHVSARALDPQEGAIDRREPLGHGHRIGSAPRLVIGQVSEIRGSRLDTRSN